ncbi:MAG: nucleotidyl transferase AbiEii/AbiGii toxin family protein [Alphaproteobacteria bacterium]|nr:nucleotidyl transferase AbiEii/AbiGii toxin family protein [Alphaproteobacteria bacterium]
MPNPIMAECDYMECEILNALFEDKSAFDTLVFSGGATLRKSYNICQRASHDIDLATSEFEELPVARSRCRLKKHVSHFKEFVFDVLMPRINYAINQDKRFMLSNDREWRALHNPEQQTSYPTLHILYQSAINRMFQHICIEIIPRKYDKDTINYQSVTPYSTKEPMGIIPTVACEQTFWDKMFALNSFATTGTPKNKFFISRHYYDVVTLMPFVNLRDTRHMLQNTVRYQQIYTTKNIPEITSPADLSLCMAPNLMLELKQDYETNAAEFLSTPPKWGQILNKLAILQKRCAKIAHQGR